MQEGWEGFRKDKLMIELVLGQESITAQSYLLLMKQAIGQQLTNGEVEYLKSMAKELEAQMVKMQDERFGHNG